MFSKFITSKFSGYLAILGILGIFMLVYYIYNEGKQACVNEVVNLEVGLMEKRNEIANMRPDAVTVVKRLRDGSF